MGTSHPIMQASDAALKNFPKDFILVSQVQHQRYGRGNVYEHTRQQLRVFEKVIAVEDPQHQQQWKDALKRHQALNNPLVVKLLAYTIFEDEAMCTAKGIHIKAYYEYIEDNIAHRLQVAVQRNQPIKENAIWYVMYNVSRVLSYLYSRNHYDNYISLGNICLSDRGVIKLLPNSCFATDLDVRTRIVKGHLDYIDPSLLPQLLQSNNVQARMKNDTFALGISILEMATKTRLRPEYQSQQINGLLQQCSSSYSTQLLQVMSQLVASPDQRPFLNEVERQLSQLDFDFITSSQQQSSQSYQTSYISQNDASTVTMTMDAYLALLQQSQRAQQVVVPQVPLHQIAISSPQTYQTSPQQQIVVPQVPVRQIAVSSPQTFRSQSQYQVSVSPQRFQQPQYTIIQPTIGMPQNRLSVAPQRLSQPFPMNVAPLRQAQSLPIVTAMPQAPPQQITQPQAPPMQAPPQQPPPPLQTAPPPPPAQPQLPQNFQQPSLYLNDPNVQKAADKPFEYNRPKDTNPELEQRYQRALNNAAQALNK